MSLKETLENKTYKNWLQSGLALKYLKEGLAPFVTNKIQQQHESFLVGITNSCDICDLDRLLPPHAPAVGKTCSRFRNRCLCIGSKRTYRMHCPNEVCGKMYDNIMEHHRYQEPGWMNSDMHKWSQDAWEVAKCYISIRGYAESTSADDMDCNGLLSIVINNLAISAMNDTLSQKCTSVRNRRNQIMHSPTLEVSDADLQAHFTEIVDILESSDLKHDEHAKMAKEKVKKLQENEIFISMNDEIELRKESLNAIKQKQTNLEEKHAEVVKEIKDMEKSFTVRLGNIDTSQHATDTKVKSMQDDIEEYSQDLHSISDKISDIQTTISQYSSGQSQLMPIVNELKSRMKLIEDESTTRNVENKQQFEEMRLEMNKLQSKIRYVLEDDLKIESKLKDQAKEQLLYLQKKQDLQKELVEVYERHISTLQLSPFIADLDTNIDEVFVDLVVCDDLLHTRVDEGVRTGGNALNVDFYKDIFYKDGAPCKNVYMLGDAGMGKTTWCMKFLRTWVTALRKLFQSEDKVTEGNVEFDEDELCALQFDIVAFVPMRHCTDESLIINMIKNQLFAENSDLNSTFRDILQTEPSKCLIVLDGLDEWSKPSNIKFSFSQNQNIPGRNDIHGCPVLTTSRPWKIYSVGLKESDIDRAVRIQGVKDRDLMAKKMIKTLNTKIPDPSPKLFEDFDKSFKDFQELNHIASLPFDDKLPLSDFMNVPLILVIMVCLWFESGIIQKSFAGNYWAMTGYLIKYAESQRHIKPFGDGSNYYPILKSCPTSVRKLIHKYMPLIIKLSKFAFGAVFKSDLVFDENTLRKVLSNEEIQASVKLGFLSQSKAIGKVLSRMTKLSFLHKSLQEFFAAIHIVFGANQENKVPLKKFVNYCNSPAKLSEMENIVMFVCGLDPKTASEISASISSLNVLDSRVKENDKMYMYVAYSLPLKCAMQVNACDAQYPCKEFPIHIKHVYVENNEKYRPILAYMYRLLEANSDNIKTIAVNTGLVSENSVEEDTEAVQFLKKSPLSQQPTEPILLPNTLSAYYKSPKELTDCTLYGLDLSSFLKYDLQKIERSFKELRNLKIVNIGKLRGFKLLHVNLSNCDIKHFSLKDTNNTVIKLNLSKLERLLLENGCDCKTELSGNDAFTCMHLKGTGKIDIVSRQMVGSEITIKFSCLGADKIIIENCKQTALKFECNGGCCHQSVQINKFIFDRNQRCTITVPESMIIDEVSIHIEPGISIDIPVEYIFEHARNVSVHLPLLDAVILKSPRIETLDIDISENERKNLDIVKNNIKELELLRYLNLKARNSDPSHVLTEKLLTSLETLICVEIMVSEENFSRNTWMSLFHSFQRKPSPWTLKVQDVVNRGVELTKCDGDQTRLICKRLLSKDLKSVVVIINDLGIKADRFEAVEIGANTLDTSVLRTLQKLTKLKEMHIDLVEETGDPGNVKQVKFYASKLKECKTFACVNVLDSTQKLLVNFLLSHPLVKSIETFNALTIKQEEMNASLYENISKITKVKNVNFSFLKETDSDPATAEERMYKYLVSVDQPGHSLFCVTVGKGSECERMLKLYRNSLQCCNFSIGIITNILSFAARPSRYKDCLTTLDVKATKINSQCLMPIAQLEQLQTFKMTTTQRVLCGQILEKLFVALKHLHKLTELHVNDGPVRCTFSAENMSLMFINGKKSQTTIAEQTPLKKRNERAVVKVKRIEITCKHTPLKDFRHVLTCAASLETFSNSQIEIVHFKTKSIEKRLASVGSISKLKELIEKMSEEDFLQGNWI